MTNFASILLCILVLLVGFRAFKTQEAALNLWLFGNALMIVFIWELNPYGVGSYVIPAASNALIAFLISQYEELSKVAYYLLVGTVLAAVVNLFSAVFALFDVQGVIVFDNSNYHFMMLIPLIIMLLGFFTGGHGHYRRSYFSDSSARHMWAFDRLSYHKTA